MKRLRFSSLLLIFLLSWVFAPQVSKAGGSERQVQPLVLTLEQAISLALERNRDVLIAEQDRYKADAQIGEAKSGAFPQVSFSGQYERNVKPSVLFLPPGSAFNTTGSVMTIKLGSDNSYTAGLQLSQTLFSPKLRTAIDIAEDYQEFTQKSYEGTTQDVVLGVKRAFYAVMLAQRLVDVSREGLEVAKANYENVRSLYNHGAAAEYDFLRAEVQVASTEPMLIQAENNLELAKNALKNLLAVDLKQEIEVKGDFIYAETPADLVQQANSAALEKNPTIRQLALQESILQKNIDIERADYFPTLSLFGSYQWQTQDNSFRLRDYTWAQSLVVGVQVSYSLFNGFRTSSRAEQASIDRQKVQYTRLKAEEGLSIQILQAQLNMEEAKKRIAAQEKSISQAEKALAIAQTRYKSGVGTQLELLDTEAALTRTQTNYAQAVYDFLIAKAEWERAVGWSQDVH
ncbi:MAG: TolC family protein [Bacteroidota bacterium]